MGLLRTACATLTHGLLTPVIEILDPSTFTPNEEIAATPQASTPSLEAPAASRFPLKCRPMPTFSFRGDSLYYEVCGAGPPWILHHGFGQRGRSWTEAGWTGPLSERFTLMLLDAVGYGKSSRGGNLDAYLIPTRALALAALATHLDFVKFGVFGFSLGGRASLELGAIGDDRLGGMVVAGMKARMTTDDVRGTPARVRALRSGRVKSLGPAVRGPEDNDAESLALSLEGVARWAGVWDRIDRIEVPALLVCGDKDSYYEGALEAAAAMPQGEFFVLPGVTHDDSFSESALSLPVVTNFMTRVSATWPHPAG